MEQKNTLLSEKEQFSKDEKVKSLYSERASIVKRISEIDRMVMDYIKDGYPLMAKEVADKLKRDNLYKQSFKRQSRVKHKYR